MNGSDMAKPGRQSSPSKRLAGLAAVFAFTAISGAIFYLYRHAVTDSELNKKATTRREKLAPYLIIVYSKDFVDNGILNSHMKELVDLVLVIPPGNVKNKSDQDILASRFVSHPSRVIPCDLDESLKHVVRHLGPVLGPTTTAVKPDPRTMSRRDVILPENLNYLIPEIQRYVGNIIVIPDDPIRSKQLWDQYNH